MKIFLEEKKENLATQTDRDAGPHKRLPRRAWQGKRKALQNLNGQGPCAQEFGGSKRTPTTSFRFRVSRVTPAEPRSDSRTRRRSKIARKTCVLQIAFSAPRLRRPNSSGSPQNASEPGRQSGTRPGAVLGSWYATTSNAAARETPRHQGTAVWQAGLRE